MTWDNPRLTAEDIDRAIGGMLDRGLGVEHVDVRAAQRAYAMALVAEADRLEKNGSR